MNAKTLYVKIERAGRAIADGQVLTRNVYDGVEYVELIDKRRGYVYVKQDIDKMLDCTFTYYE